MKHPPEIHSSQADTAPSHSPPNGMLEVKMEVLVEMSANILNGGGHTTKHNGLADTTAGHNNDNNNNHSPNKCRLSNKSPTDSIEDVTSDIHNIKLDPGPISHPGPDDKSDNKGDIEEESGPTRRKSKRLKKIRIEKRKEVKEERARKRMVAVENGEDLQPKAVQNDEDEEAMISLENIVGLPNFVPIDENIYLFSRNKSKKNKIECDCAPLTREEKEQGLRGCEDGCLNRMLNYECGSKCPLGKRCANRRFQKKEYARIIPFKTEMKGWGLMALEDIEVNRFIMEYVGEVIDAFHFHDRVDAYAAEKIPHYYFMSLKKDEIIDSTKKGNITRFINHSCEPNCTTQKWVTGNEDRIGFFAIKPIKKGEELTFDYQFQRYGEKAQKCYCGTPSCRGVIGSAKAGPSILTDGTKIDDKLRQEIELNQEQQQDDIIEELYQLYHEDGIDNYAIVKDIMKFIVDVDITKHNLQAKIIDVLLATKSQTYLKLLLDYRCLIFIWEWMKKSENLDLKIDCLRLMKVLPIDNRTIVVENKVFSIVEAWSKNPRQRIDNIEEMNTSDVDKESKFAEMQRLSLELIKNWNALPEAAKIPKDMKIKMRKSDEQKARNEEETSKNEQNDNRKKEIKEKFRREVNSRHWSVQNYSMNNANNNSGQNIEPMTEEEFNKQMKARQTFREQFERNIAQVEYQKALDKYQVDYSTWLEAYKKQQAALAISSAVDPRLQAKTGLSPIGLSPIVRPIPEPMESVIESKEIKDVKETVVEKEKICGKRKRIDFLLEPFDELTISSGKENVEEEEDLGFLDFKSSVFDEYKEIYDHRTIIIKSDFKQLLNTKCPNVTTVLDADQDHFDDYDYELPADYIDNVPLVDVNYQSDDVFDTMNKTVFDATYPYPGAYVNLDGSQYMQGVQDQTKPEMVCKEIRSQPLPISFTVGKSKPGKVPHPWRVRQTADRQTFYYNPITMFTQWSHPDLDPSENLSMVEVENVVTGKPLRKKVQELATVSTDSKLSAEQLRINKRNNSIILKQGEERTKQRLEREKQKRKEAVRKAEEEHFRCEVSKYVVKCLNPHFSTDGKVRKIKTKAEFKKIAESFTKKVVEIEVSTNRNVQKKLILTDLIKEKIKHKIKQYVHSK